jgi:hypothetical protein
MSAKVDPAGKAPPRAGLAQLKALATTTNSAKQKLKTTVR